MDCCLPTAAYLPVTCGRKGNNREVSKTRSFLCFAESRGFGAEPSKKGKGSNAKTPKESILTTSEPSKAASGVLRTRTKTGTIGGKSNEPIFDRQFLEKVESVRRSAYEQKKAEGERIFQPIDYDAPIESEQSKIGLLTKGAAVTLVELGEYQRASSLLEKLIKERPENVDAYRLLGEVKYELKDFEGSAAAYRSCLSTSKSLDFDVLRGLTNALLAVKKPDEAVQVLLSSRENINVAENIGLKDSTVQLNEVDRKSQGIDPIQIELLLGKAYSDWGHVSDAVAVYDQLISKHPNDFRGYLAKGIILKENGKVGDAERMFIQQARFFAPEKAKALVDRYSRQ